MKHTDVEVEEEQGVFVVYVDGEEVARYGYDEYPFADLLAENKARSLREDSKLIQLTKTGYQGITFREIML